MNQSLTLLIGVEYNIHRQDSGYFLCPRCEFQGSKVKRTFRNHVRVCDGKEWKADFFSDDEETDDSESSSDVEEIEVALTQKEAPDEIEDASGDDASVDDENTAGDGVGEDNDEGNAVGAGVEEDEESDDEGNAVADEAAPVAESELKVEPFLASLGFAIQMRLRSLVCLECGNAVQPAHAIAHAKGHFSDNKIPKHLGTITEVAARITEIIATENLYIFYG